MGKSEGDEVGTDEASIVALRDYWMKRLDEFENVEYPVFKEKLYSKNTALLVVMMDELTDAISIAAARRK